MGTQEEMIAEIKSLRKRVKGLEERDAAGQNVGEQLATVSARLEKLEEKLKDQVSTGEEGPMFEGIFDED